MAAAQSYLTPRFNSSASTMTNITDGDSMMPKIIPVGSVTTSTTHKDDSIAPTVFYSIAGVIVDSDAFHMKMLFRKPLFSIFRCG